MVNFIYAPDAHQAADQLADRLVSELKQHKRVLWLVCGGSNITLAVHVMEHIPTELQSNLAIMLTDERFGKINHPDSNWFQLDKAGFVPGDAYVIPTLVDGLSLTETAERYAKVIDTALSNADVTIAQFGIGPDGHIAGVLPDSSAVDATALVHGYQTDTFSRVTLTPKALRRITVAYAFVYGDNKKEALEKLQKENLPLREEPSQILKELPEAYVYNDQIGDAA